MSTDDNKTNQETAPKRLLSAASELLEWALSLVKKEENFQLQDTSNSSSSPTQETKSHEETIS